MPRLRTCANCGSDFVCANPNGNAVCPDCKRMIAERERREHRRSREGGQGRSGVGYRLLYDPCTDAPMSVGAELGVQEIRLAAQYGSFLTGMRFERRGRTFAIRGGKMWEEK